MSATRSACRLRTPIQEPWPARRRNSHICSETAPDNRFGVMEADDSPTGTGRRVLITGAVAAMGIGAGVAAAKITDSEDDSSPSEGSFTVVDRRGKQRFLLGTSKPPIIFRPRIELRVALDGTPSIAMLDAEGRIIKQL